MIMSLSKSQLGQFFTTQSRVQEALSSLIENTDTNSIVLEPSAGAGHLVQVLKNKGFNSIEAVEFDKTIKNITDIPFIYEDFFTHKGEGYKTILGNPPYVAWKSVANSTRTASANTKSRYGDKVNLYMLFIDRLIDKLAQGGELILITPKEWLYSTSASPLRHKMEQTGALTHIIDCGEAPLFDDAAVPALLIFRFLKGKKQGPVTYSEFFTHTQTQKKHLIKSGDRWLILSEKLKKLTTQEGWGTLGDLFSIKVGIVSGADSVFRTTLNQGTPYLTTKGVELFLDYHDTSDWEEIPEEARQALIPHKEALLGRKIAQFDETNWWKWGAVRNKEIMMSERARFYTHNRTRAEEPFFTHKPTKLYSGGVLGLFLKENLPFTPKIEDCIKLLNSSLYGEFFIAMGLTTGNKKTFQPSTLEIAPFPVSEEALNGVFQSFNE